MFLVGPDKLRDPWTALFRACTYCHFYTMHEDTTLLRTATCHLPGLLISEGSLTTLVVGICGSAISLILSGLSRSFDLGGEAT